MDGIHTYPNARKRKEEVVGKQGKKAKRNKAIYLSTHFFFNSSIVKFAYRFMYYYFFLFPGNDRAEGSLAKDEAFCVMMLGLCIQYI